MRISQGIVAAILLTVCGCTQPPQNGAVTPPAAPGVAASSAEAPTGNGQTYADRLHLKVSSGPEQALTLPLPDTFIDASGYLPAVPKSAYGRISESGDYFHPATRLKFPASVGEMQRVYLSRQYAQDESVNAVYEFPGGGPKAFVAVGPIWTRSQEHLRIADVPAKCKDVFAAEKFREQLVSAGARPAGEHAETSARFPDAALNQVALYDADADLVPPAPVDGRPIRAELHVICGAGKVWVVTYRITYPQHFDAAAFVTAFMRAVPAAR